MGFCIKGRVVVAPNQAEPRAIYSASEPQIVYRASQSDINYWGFDYATFDNGASFAPGYQIFQSDEAGCGLDPDRYDCLNGACVLSTTYDTPGQYESLEACQAECGSGMKCNPPNICVPPDHCPDGYVCIADFEWVEIKRLLS